MEIAIISDMHGNCFALEHVLNDIRRLGITQIVCLGDAIQGGAEPASTLARLREVGCPIVMGNADAWLLSGQDTAEQTTSQQMEVRAWALDQLTEDDLAFMRQFQPTIEIPLEAGKSLLCFHGSPSSFDDIIQLDTPSEVVHGFLDGWNATFLSGGHTHTQQHRRVGPSWYINPGSVSLAYNWEESDTENGQMRVDPWADYAILSTSAESFGVTFRHVPFDVDQLARIVRKSGRPYAEDMLKMYL